MPDVPRSICTIPNLLSLSRVPLAVVLFAYISEHNWPVSLGIFMIAAFTDWLDGYLARRWKQTSFIGRALDPLTDKLLVCGAFIYLLPYGANPPDTGLTPWMVTVVIGREILITGVRGIVESAGIVFGADWFGKLKTVLQMGMILAALTVQMVYEKYGEIAWLRQIYMALLVAMLFATIGSGLQYLAKAAILLNRRGVKSVESAPETEVAVK